MSSKNPLVPTTDKMVKGGINYTKTKHNVVEKDITHHKVKNKIDVINETDKPQACQTKKDKSIRNELKKVCRWINKGLLKELK